MERLKQLREEKGKSQFEIATLLDISRPQYSLYETDKRKIPVYLLSQLAKYYKTSIDYIVGDTDKRRRYK